MSDNRSRKNRIVFYLSDDELEFLKEKMTESNVSNREAYIRKMVLDGYIIRVDYSDVRELSRLLRNATNNLNQVARRANETRIIFESDIKDLQIHYDKLWTQAEHIMKKLAKL